MIYITEEALGNALKLQEENPEWRGLDLRLYLEGKGCDGFNYGVTFDQKESTDHAYPSSSGKESVLNIIVDEKTLEFVKDSKISWQVEETQSGFIVTNPRHKNYRGKFYQRSYWQKKLKKEEK